jgi:putative holliday junction resolvase
VKTPTSTPLHHDPHLHTIRSGTVLAFDYGTRRLGVAVGELSLRIAHPLETIRADSEEERLEQVGRLVKEWSPVLLVVGLPSHMDGIEHKVAALCRRFAARSSTRFGIPARLVDERLTSHAAGLSLAEAGVGRRRQKEVLDQVAAQHILEAFFCAPDDAT